MTASPHLLVTLSSHGFGHAAQTAPVVNALRALVPNLQVSIRTELPRHFLASRFEGEFDLLPATDDFGLAMESALAVAHERSAQRYAALHAHWDIRIAEEAAAISRLKPDLVLSNVSYLALAGARAARVPGVALCSFTWAQVYAHYFSARPEAATVLAQMHAAYLGAEQVFALQPGMPLDHLPRVRTVGVVARLGQARAPALCRHLGLRPGTRLVVFSLGGIDHPLDLARWPQVPDIHWLVPKALLPNRTDMTAQEDLPFHFTDLLASADAFIAKPGYGSFTEAACNGAAILYAPRLDWPEQPYLVDWITLHARALPVGPEQLTTGDLQASLRKVWNVPPPAPVVPAGAELAARLLANYL